MRAYGKPSRVVGRGFGERRAARGCVVLVLLPQTELVDDDPLAGSLVVELSPNVTSAIVEVPDAPPGPLSVDHVESQLKIASMSRPLEMPTVPYVKPSPVEPEPDLAVPPPVEKPPVEETKVTEQVTVPNASTSSAASEATRAAAPPKVEAPPAATPTAVDVGLSPLALRAKATLEQGDLCTSRSAQALPGRTAVQGVLQAERWSSSKLTRDGKIGGARISQSSGSPALDGAALDMLSRASPLPPTPANVPGTTFILVAPIIFQTR